MWHALAWRRILAHPHCSGTSFSFLLLPTYFYVSFVPLNNPHEIDRMTSPWSDVTHFGCSEGLAYGTERHQQKG
jgi:hypothetical protein